MSGIYILKNVFSFAQILNLAASEHLQKWDESTLQKAFNWSQYCEEVYKHVSRQGYAKDINPKIIQMTALLTPASLLTLDFDCLRVATKLLIETILTNSNGSLDLKKRLESAVDSSVWQEISAKIKARPPFNDLDKSLSLLWIRNQSKLQTTKDRKASVYAEVLISNILTVMMASENEQRFQQYCASLFDRLVSLERGWELVVHIFSVDFESLSSGTESLRGSLLSILLSWMNYKMSDATKCPILDLNLDVLRMASVGSSGFLSFYLSSLEKWGQSFQPCLEGLGKDFWRDSYNNGACDLSKHFHRLLSCNVVYQDSEKDVKSQVLGVLTRNMQNSDFSVWRTVVSSLLR